jgi:hypothetical protein
MNKAPIGVSWGTTNIPKDKWIDPTDLDKTYQTKSGKSIRGLQITMTNSLDNEVTFPVKGSVDMGKGKRPKFMIWTLDGRADLFQETNFDLKEVRA